jgi:mono/diheme cytochrome c family protein
MVVSCGPKPTDAVTENKTAGSDTVAAPIDTTAPGIDTAFTGQELFRRSCAGCHRIDREGKPPTYPSLVYIKDKMSKDEIFYQIMHGKGLMVSHSHLPDNEINAIIAYLFNEPDQQVVIENYKPVTIGKNIVLSNCVSCHRLKEEDPMPHNAKRLCPLVEPSALVTGAHKLDQKKFMLVLKTGPCYMPSFDYLTENDKGAIWSYLKTL